MTEGTLLCGPITCCGFHGLTAAPTVHASLLARGVEAAVLDHAYVLSPTHLMTALYRLGETRPSSGFSGACFASFSLKHNLDRILNVLPAGGNTTAVLVVFRSASEEARAATAAAVREAVGAATPGGVALPHSLHGSPYFTPHADVGKVKEYYGITDDDVRSTLSSFTTSDLLSCGGGETELRLRAVEVCVINRLSTHGV